MNTVIIEAPVGAYVLPPQVMEIKLVRIISDINKPLDQLTIQDICNWHEKNNKLIEYIYKLPDKYSVGGIDCTVHALTPYGSNVVIEIDPNEKIEVGDKISSESIRNGAILKCMQVSDDGRYITWEDFAGGNGYAETRLFKKYVPGVDKFMFVKSNEKEDAPTTSKILNTFRLNTGDLIVHVFDNTFKRGDYVLENIYISEVFEYENYYGLVLKIDAKRFQDLGYATAIHDNKIHLVNVQNPMFKKGTIIANGIIIDTYASFTTEPDIEKSVCSIRIYDQAFIPGHDIKKHNNKNYYENTSD